MPTLTWDTAPAYDFLVSLMAIHDPETFSLRPSWAAGIRSRLPTAEREFLQRLSDAKLWPLPWIYHLPAPKDSRTLLAELRRLPAAERLMALLPLETISEPVLTILLEVMARGAWSTADLERIMAHIPANPTNKPRAGVAIMLDFWANPTAFGEMLLLGLESFYSEFFAEEEGRIVPHLQAAAEQGQAWAAELALPELLEELSQGVRYELPITAVEIVFVPIFWTTPLIIDMPLDANRLLFAYGARPPHISQVPGEAVPEDLPLTLKALADPTRLRILRLLAERPLAPSELAQALRLRPPTVTHHLQALRLARLVRLTLSADDRRQYAIRPAGLTRVVAMLYEFVQLGE